MSHVRTKTQIEIVRQEVDTRDTTHSPHRLKIDRLCGLIPLSNIKHILKAAVELEIQNTIIISTKSQVQSFFLGWRITFILDYQLLKVGAFM